MLSLPGDTPALHLPRIEVRALSGDEQVALPPGFERDRVMHFWRWACSDVLNNTLRGLFAEWLVATALGLTDEPREEWAAVDLRTPSGTEIEVKSAAYVQSWAQKRPSPISFRIAPTRAWNGDTGTYAEQVRRQADLYVFCLLGEEKQTRVDPLDTQQWRFFVLPTSVLDKHCPTQRTIGLSTLRKLEPAEVKLAGLRGAIEKAATKNTASEGEASPA